MKPATFMRKYLAQVGTIITRMKNDPAGSDELSALITCTIHGDLFLEIVENGFDINKWIRAWSRDNDRDSVTNAFLLPYSTSMDQKLPNECIVYLKRTKRGIWIARQEGADKKVRASDPILACRLAAFRSGLWKTESPIGTEHLESIASLVDEPVGK